MPLDGVLTAAAEIPLAGTRIYPGDVVGQQTYQISGNKPAVSSIEVVHESTASIAKFDPNASIATQEKVVVHLDTNSERTRAAVGEQLKAQGFEPVWSSEQNAFEVSTKGGKPISKTDVPNVALALTNDKLPNGRGGDTHPASLTREQAASIATHEMQRLQVSPSQTSHVQTANTTLEMRNGEALVDVKLNPALSPTVTAIQEQNLHTGVDAEGRATGASSRVVVGDGKQADAVAKTLREQGVQADVRVAGGQTATLAPPDGVDPRTFKQKALDDLKAKGIEPRVNGDMLTFPNREAAQEAAKTLGRRATLEPTSHYVIAQGSAGEVAQAMSGTHLPSVVAQDIKTQADQAHPRSSQLEQPAHAAAARTAPAAAHVDAPRPANFATAVGTAADNAVVRQAAHLDANLHAAAVHGPHSSGEEPHGKGGKSLKQHASGKIGAIAAAAGVVYGVANSGAASAATVSEAALDAGVAVATAVVPFADTAQMIYEGQSRPDEIALSVAGNLVKPLGATMAVVGGVIMATSQEGVAQETAAQSMADKTAAVNGVTGKLIADSQAVINNASEASGKMYDNIEKLAAADPKNPNLQALLALKQDATKAELAANQVSGAASIGADTRQMANAQKEATLANFIKAADVVAAGGTVTPSFDGMNIAGRVAEVNAILSAPTAAPAGPAAPEAVVVQAAAPAAPTPKAPEPAPSGGSLAEGFTPPPLPMKVASQGASAARG